MFQSHLMDKIIFMRPFDERYKDVQLMEVQVYIQLNFPAKPLWYEGKSGPLQRGRGVNVINFGRQRWLIFSSKMFIAG